MNYIEKLDEVKSNEPIHKYVWQGERLLSVYVGVSSVYVRVYYALTDANKNITEYIDSSGNISAHYEYSPFGRITVSTGTIPSDFDFRFSSEYYDPETKLYFPELGRWVSRDPIGEDNTSLNQYLFIENNILFVDFLGREPVLWGGWISDEKRLEQGNGIIQKEKKRNMKDICVK